MTALHSRTVLFPKNVGSILTRDHQRVAIDTTGVISIDGVRTLAVASMLVELSDDQIYVKGLKTGKWWRYAGQSDAVHWDTPGTDAMNVLETLQKVPS